MPVVSMAELSSTFQENMKKVVDTTARTRPLINIIRRDGGLEGNKGGTKFTWPMKFKQRGWTPDDDTIAPNFVRDDNHRTAEMSWKSGHYAAELPKREMERNQYIPTQILDRVDLMMNDVAAAFEQKFPAMLLNNSTTDSTQFDGIESGLNHNTSTAAANQGAEGRVRLPTSTYANVSIVPGGVTGSWDTNSGTGSTTLWPMGNGDESYTFNSPVLLNSTSQVWGATSATWKTHCEQQLMWLLYILNTIRSPQGPPNTIMLSPKLKHELALYYAATARTMIENSPRTDLSPGFDVQKFQGIDLVSDFDMDNDTGYVFNSRVLKYRSIYPDFVANSPVEWTQDGTRMICRSDYHGNLMMESMCGFGKIYPYGNWT